MGSVTTRLPSDVTLQGHFFPRDHFFSYGTRHAISPFRSGVHYIFQIFESRPISHLQNVINMFLLLFHPLCMGPSYVGDTFCFHQFESFFANKIPKTRETVVVSGQFFEFPPFTRLSVCGDLLLLRGTEEEEEEEA